MRYGKNQTPKKFCVNARRLEWIWGIKAPRIKKGYGGGSVVGCPPGGYGAADAIRNGDQVARAYGYHGRAVAPYCPDDNGSTYGYHSKLTARIVAGASAQWHGTRTATIYGNTSARPWRWRRHPTSMTANIYQWQRQHIRRGTTSRRIWWRTQ